MKRAIEDYDASQVARERPRFGQLAREVLGLTADDLADSLARQRRDGGRLGAILQGQGLLTGPHVAEVLGRQARWVAQAMGALPSRPTFPQPVFLSLCLPAFNEEDNIADTLDAACAILPAFVDRFEVVVVDDGSQDRTGEVVRRYAERHPCVRGVRHARNRGYGAAVTAGLRAARGDLVALADADGQFSFLDLPHFLVRLEGREVVVGYRHRRADSPLRLLNAWGWNWLIRLFLGVRVKDLDCAFKVFRRQVIDGLDLTATGAAINAEIMAQCAGARLRVAETPVLHYTRQHGTATGAQWGVIWRAFRELPRLRKYRCLPPPATPARA